MGRPEPPRCHGTRKNGGPCGRTPPRGKDYCPWHDPDESVRAAELERTQKAARLGGRPRVPKVTEVVRQAVEAVSEEILRVYFKPLGLELVGWDDEGHPVVERRGDGLRMAGVSKDGEVIMSPYEDAMGKVKIAELLMDRVYGKPRQSHEVVGNVHHTGGVDVPRDKDRQVEVAKILQDAGLLDAAPKALDVPDADVIDGNATDVDPHPGVPKDGHMDPGEATG